jgi:adenylylsulfate kinase
MASTVNLGFDNHDRTLNVIRTAKVAKLMKEEGLVVIVNLVSQLKSNCEETKRTNGFINFVELFMDTP